MIIDEIVLENFGVFRGRQSLQLTPESATKPLILIGGLNGGGKTTLLDALQLALYGRFAHCSSRGNLGYGEFIKRCIHRGIATGDSVSVELRFRRLIQGEEQRYEVRRWWDLGVGDPVEHATVFVNGTEDAALTEGWTEHIEAIIPQGVSTLFFFDGEKIEELATPKSAAAVLSTAINSLLGLEIVDRLNTDLIVLNRRKTAAVRPDAEKERIRVAEAEIRTLEKILENAEIERAQHQNVVDQAQRALSETEAKYRKEGGILLGRKENYEREAAAAKQQLQQKRAEFWHHVGGPAPLLLVTDQLQDILLQATHEFEREDALMLGKTLETRDRDLLSKLRKTKPVRSVLPLIERFLANDRERRKPRGEFESYLNMDRSAAADIEQLVGTILPAAKKRERQLRTEVNELKDRLTDLERMRASLPEEELVEAIADILTKMRTVAREAQSDLELSEAKVVQIRRELEQKNSALVRLLESDVESKLELSDEHRVVAYAARVRHTLADFREAIIARHVKRIEHYVLECFQQLLHKTALVTGIRIDPESYALSLFGGDRLPLPPERLSAGERQLLAVALLWGLARAAGRALPTFIDTPLGRLDAGHRQHLVSRYFPFASHQVVLLSTDKEIEGDYYHALAPYITREYTLVHDDRDRCSRIELGFFPS